MSKILMLDLEGVLIATAISVDKYWKKKDFGVRPFAKKFIEESAK